MDSPQVSDNVLRGWPLAFAWLGWVSVVALSVTVYTAITLVDEQNPLLSIWFPALFFAPAALILWRRPSDWVAMMVALVLVIFPLNLTLEQEGILIDRHPQWRVMVGLRDAFGLFTVMFLLLYLFPSGRFVPRWGWLIIVTYLVASLSVVVFPQPGGAVGAAGFLLFGSIFVSGLASQVYRFRRISSPLERQQTKWITFGVASAFTGMMFWYFFLSEFGLAIDAENNVLLFLILMVAQLAMLFTLPVSVLIAVLRYRLWDIDVIINRALVFGTLTATLGSAYFGGVLLLQAGFRAVSDQESSLAIVVSTLAIAALFQPLRQGLQALIDRRFYRRKYNAARTLANFGATVRDEVDIERLSVALVSTASETVQPAHASLWLRET